MGENGWRRYALFTCSQEKNKKEDLLVGMFKESPRLGRMFMITRESHRGKFARGKFVFVICRRLRYLTMKVSNKKVFDRKPEEIFKNSCL